jgi:hypothetical protein
VRGDSLRVHDQHDPWGQRDDAYFGWHIHDVCGSGAVSQKVLGVDGTVALCASAGACRASSSSSSRPSARLCGDRGGDDEDAAVELECFVDGARGGEKRTTVGVGSIVDDDSLAAVAVTASADIGSIGISDSVARRAVAMPLGGGAPPHGRVGRWCVPRSCS